MFLIPNSCNDIFLGRCECCVNAIWIFCFSNTLSLQLRVSTLLLLRLDLTLSPHQHHVRIISWENHFLQKKPCLLYCRNPISWENFLTDYLHFWCCVHRYLVKHPFHKHFIHLFDCRMASARLEHERLSQVNKNQISNISWKNHFPPEFESGPSTPQSPALPTVLSRHSEQYWSSSNNRYDIETSWGLLWKQKTKSTIAQMSWGRHHQYSINSHKVTSYI